MRSSIFLGLALVVALVVGFAVQAELFPANYVYQKSYLCSDKIQAEFIPADTHVTGYIRAENPFSAYVVVSNSGYFESLEKSEVVHSWENVTEVKLDFDVPGENCYLVVKNGNTNQIVEIKFKAER
ncbi:Hypothetical drug exporter [Thermococcus onnurineus NA1]|uniref:Hypothetical drug exporter n=1 Tax=Thermococcus onnurineus (strain NA1) TaxID=523850 RepID=B6YW49_THEON|nr:MULTISPECIES: hypothetical protein [Thermococcus]ACJ17415.1 Hypothetical drug exporter [Thermococcus onnurineus NA1]NJE45847.1 multidrug transporter [Thermococcus sp. GR7]NJE79191.1 multidrug transporter [Thermococcus sp. GR4]NJF22041.1 multidrug transporter [Thermococcus sp. GR5]